MGSSRLTQRMRVLLPEPDGPHTTMTSPRRHREAHVAEHVEGPEPLVHVDELDGGGHGYSMTTRTSPGLTAWPACTRISLTVPSAAALELVLHLHGLEDHEAIAPGHALAHHDLDEDHAPQAWGP